MEKTNIDEMSIIELSRWGALLKAIDLIEENCENIGKKFEDLDLKPIAIKHYINSFANNIQQELEAENKLKEKKKKENLGKVLTKKLLSSSFEGNGALQDKKVSDPFSKQ
jgi:hypothetical protein